MNITQDKSTDSWRAEREPSGRPAGPVDVWRYQLQMEPVGIQTFFKLPVARTPEDLRPGEVDVANLVPRPVLCPIPLAIFGRLPRCGQRGIVAAMTIQNFRSAGSNMKRFWRSSPF